MRFTIRQELFSSVLSRAQSILERKTTRPILETVLLEAHGENLKVSSTDLRVSLSQDVACSAVEAGTLAVGGKKLTEIVRELPRDDVTLELDENQWLAVRAGKGVFHLPVTNAQEYPTFPESPESFLRLDASMFRQALEKTLFAASTDESRLYLCGVFVKQWEDEAGTGHLTMVATDGHRLSMVNRQISLEIPAFREGVVIPRKGLAELRSLLEGDQERFEIGASAGRVFAKVDKSLLSVLLIDESFPNYNQVIPVDSHNKLRLNRMDLMDALRRIALVSDTDTHSVILEAASGVSTLSSTNPQIGDGREDIETDYAGEGFRLAFNASYAMDALRSIDGDFIELAMNDALAPCTIRGEGDSGHLCVIMPMRID